MDENQEKRESREGVKKRSRDKREKRRGCRGRRNDKREYVNTVYFTSFAMVT